jgi:Pyruvate/2-oxoacid:ferredoxin oxidoreductase delta subunit
MAIREIVEIDEERCNGCGQCIPQCAEGALRIVDGKARLVSDRHCDGLGACLGTCPQDAIRIVRREAEEFDESVVTASNGPGSKRAEGFACPAAAAFDRAAPAARPSDVRSGGASALTQWPVQLRLVPVKAPFLDGADLLLAADCVPFAMGSFHRDLLAGRRLLIGCPKLDDAAYYVEKLGEILKANQVRSLTVVHMEVPCCHGMTVIARRALAASGKDIPLSEITVGIGGSVKEQPGPNGMS